MWLLCVKEQTGKKLTTIYHSGINYKPILLALEIQSTQAKTIIYEQRKYGTLDRTCPAVAGLTKLLQDPESKATSKAMQPKLDSVKVCVFDSTTEKRLGKKGIHGRGQKAKNTAY